ncbi:hypothetical protein Tco_0965465 [Tanacetum coccineum]
MEKYDSALFISLRSTCAFFILRATVKFDLTSQPAIFRQYQPPSTKEHGRLCSPRGPNDYRLKCFLNMSNPGPNPSESNVFPVCDVPFHDNSPPFDISKDQSEDFSDSNVDSTSTDEDSFSSNDVEYVEASPPNSEQLARR